MIQKLKGTKDIIEDSKNYKYLEEVIHTICSNFNFNEIRTPLFEKTELFLRGVGETSDIVSKEMYTFNDKGNRSLTLRPEGTAGVVRAFIENKLYALNEVNKLYYIAPMFRYERPQKGRQRQFNQFGIEAFGTDSLKMDAEVIILMYNLLKIIGIEDATVLINSLGDANAINRYKEALKGYFTPFIDEMCDDCKDRINKNPLRILDCKKDKNHDCMKNIPKLFDFLSDDDNNEFKELCCLLDSAGVKFVVDNKLVRGLDYYSKTVFEIVSNNELLGTQNTLAAGGRYNNLVNMLGGPKTPAVGAGLGIERVLLALGENPFSLDDKLDSFVISMDDSSKDIAFELVNNLRMNGYKSDIDYLNKSVKSQFKLLNKKDAKAVILIGEQELVNGFVKVKIDGNEEEVEINKIVEYLDGRI